MPNFKILFTKKRSPWISRREFYFKLGSLIGAALAQDIAGSKIAWFDQQVTTYQLPRAVLTSPFYFYLYVVQGLLLGIAAWNLLYIWWWAKDAIKDPGYYLGPDPDIK